MTTCPQHHRLQDFLDGDLPEREAASFAAHLEGCDSCGSELALFTRLDAMLERAPDWDPGVGFTERVLDRVVPSRLRRRFVTVVGWTYGSVTAVSTFALATWLSRPTTPRWIAEQLSELYIASLRTGVFAFQTLVTGLLRVGDGAGLVESFRLHVAPLVRAMGLALSHPVLAATLVSALIGSLAVLWWMGPRAATARGDRHKGGSDHVGLLGF